MSRIHVRSNVDEFIDEMSLSALQANMKMLHLRSSFYTVDTLQKELV